MQGPIGWKATIHAAYRHCCVLKFELRWVFMVFAKPGKLQRARLLNNIKPWHKLRDEIPTTRS